jgi:hypothetical protein
LELISPVAAGGVDVVFAEDFAGVEVDDGGGGFVGDREDAFAGVSAADAEVVHAAGAADADVSVGIDAVVAESVAVGELPLAGRAFGVAW